MKKYINILFLLATICGVLTSCEEQLEFKNDGRLTMDDIFDSERRTRGYLNACYDYLVYSNIQWSSYSDEAEDSDKTAGSRFTRWYGGDATASTFAQFAPDYPWQRLYTGIRMCNIFLANIGTAAPGQMSDEKRQGLEAQARTLRALYYLKLIQRFGGVPIITNELTPDHDYSNDRKATFSEVATFIIEEIDLALQAPATRDGFSWDVYAGQWGIMTRAVAYAIKSRAATYAASPLWSDGTFTWEDATEINKEALYQCLSNDYSLFVRQPDPADAQNAYALYFITSSDDGRATDKETIYRGTNINIWRDAGLPTTAGMISAGPSPTQDLIDSYEMANGELPILGYNDNDRLDPVINPASGYDAENPYEGRDPRFYASIYYNGAPRHLGIQGSRIETFVGGAEGIDLASTRRTATGYYIRKFNNHNSSINVDADGENRLFRLAELYMNFAESAYQAFGPDANVNLGPGMSMSARDAVNAVRDRAGMPPLPSGISVNDFEKRYKNERRIEFAFEGHRYFDVRRWKILKDVEQFVTGMIIEKNENGSLTYNRFRFNNRESSDEKYLLYPINELEVNKMLNNIGVNWQNPGW